MDQDDYDFMGNASGSRRETAAEARTNRAVREAEERALVASQRSSPGVLQLASPEIPSPRTDWAMAADLAPTPEVKLGKAGWGVVTPASPAYQAAQHPSQAAQHPSEGWTALPAESSSQSSRRTPTHHMRAPIGLPPVPEATGGGDRLPHELTSNLPREYDMYRESTNHGTGLMVMGSTGRAGEVDRGRGIRGGLQRTGSRRRRSHRTRGSVGNINMNAIGGFPGDNGDIDSDCGSRIPESGPVDSSFPGPFSPVSASDISASAVSVSSAGHVSGGPLAVLAMNGGFRHDDAARDDSDGASHIFGASTAVGHRSDDARSMAGSPFTPASAVFQRHFRAGISGDLDASDSVSEVTDASPASSHPAMRVTYLRRQGTGAPVCRVYGNVFGALDKTRNHVGMMHLL